MAFAISNYSHAANSTMARLHSFGVEVEDAFNTTTQKIKDAVTSPIGQGVVGFGLGLGAHLIYGPLTEKIVSALGMSIGTIVPSRALGLSSLMTLADPFSGLGLGFKILIAPFVCIIGPIMEEQLFRGGLQEAIKDNLHPFYVNQGFSHSDAKTAARITSVFFTSVIFGLVHFSNALLFWCNPILFLPQVVAATIMGLGFGLAKEFSGELHLPIGMHIGNNTFAWASAIKASL